MSAHRYEIIELIWGAIVSLDKRLLECGPVEVDADPERKTSENVDILISKIFGDRLSDNLCGYSAALVTLYDEVLLKQEFVAINNAEN